MSNMINFNSFSTDLRELVFAVERQIPAAYPIIVSGIMTSMATAMQDLIQVRMPNGVVNPVSLAIGVIGESGDRKTSVLNLLLKPIIAFDTISEQEFNNQLSDYEIDSNIFKIKEKAIQSEIIKSIKQGNENYKLLEDQLKQLQKLTPKIPLLNVRCRSNTTIPALMRNMSKSSVGQLFVTTEAGGTINKWSMEEIGSLIGLLDGENIKVDRASTESYEIKDKRLSCAFSLQPQLYDDIISRKGNILMESGLIPRMLISKPISLQGHRIQSKPIHSPFIESFYERIEELLLQVKRKNQSQPLIEMSFDSEAEQDWFEFAHFLEGSIRYDGLNRDVSKWVNRTIDNVSRMAALIEYYIYGGEGKNHLSISKSSLQMAKDLGIFWLNETKILFGDVGPIAKQQALANKLMEYYIRQLKIHNVPLQQFVLSKKDIYSKGPRQLRSSEASQLAIDFLLAQCILTPVFTTSVDSNGNPINNPPPQLRGYCVSNYGAALYGIWY